MKTLIRRTAGLMLCLVVLICLVHCAGVMEEAPPEAVPTYEPAAEEAEEEPPEPTRPAGGPPPSPTPAATPPVAVEERIAEVEWPAAMRVGDNDLIRLSLFPAPEGGYVAEPEIEGHEVAPTRIPMAVERPGYTGYVVASLSAAGLQVEPAGPLKQPLAPGQPNTWRWTVAADQAGLYRVITGLTVIWEPEPGTELPGPLEEAVWSYTVTVRSRTVFGLSGQLADLLGVGGSVLGVVTSLPFVEKVLEVVWRRIRGGRAVGTE